MATSSNLSLLRRLLWKGFLKPLAPSSCILSRNLPEASNSSTTLPTVSRRFFSSSHLGFHDDVSLGPAPIDYSCMLQEDEFHNLADSTIHNLLEKIEEYGDSIDVDGFDIDYGNQVLTVKLGTLGTYVVNKQTPNRQIWMSSPVSGPSRFDWDQNSQAWIYRRNKEHLLKVLERELEQLCGKSITLS